ncbi:acyl carrier protein [Rhodococcus fascians]|nr:acyl carrier protein [Rhodococcus fascians]MBY4022468.1 acyl carrier protein [Rhodococcus fascians]
MTARSIDETEWLISKVAGFLNIAPETVDIDRPLAEYGLDSVYALTLCGDMEDAFGIEVEPTMAWDYPSVAAMAGFLRTQIAAEANS